MTERNAKTGRNSEPLKLQSCELCGMGRLCLSSSLLGGDLQDLKPAVRRRLRIGKGENLFLAGQRQQAVYVVRAGSVKSTDIDYQGREQVIEFCLPGDVLALEDSENQSHQSHARALEDSWVCEIPLSALHEHVFNSAPLSREMFSVMCCKVREQRQLLGRMSNADAACRVAAFLLGLSLRYRRRGLPHLRFRLSMDRADIANYLGMQLETVSRSFSSLQRRGLIRVHGKWLELADSARFEREFSAYLPAA